VFFMFFSLPENVLFLKLKNAEKARQLQGFLLLDTNTCNYGQFLQRI